MQQQQQQKEHQKQQQQQQQKCQEQQQQHGTVYAKHAVVAVEGAGDTAPLSTTTVSNATKGSCDDGNLQVGCLGKLDHHHHHHYHYGNVHTRRVQAVQFRMMHMGRVSSRGGSGCCAAWWGGCLSGRLLSSVVLAAVLFATVAVLCVPRIVAISSVARAASVTKGEERGRVGRMNASEGMAYGLGGGGDTVTMRGIGVVREVSNAMRGGDGVGPEGIVSSGGSMEEGVVTAQGEVSNENGAGRSGVNDIDAKTVDDVTRRETSFEAVRNFSSAMAAAETATTSAATTTIATPTSEAAATTATTMMRMADPAEFSTFGTNTALNYFHLHKTGGVSFKERLFNFFFRKERVKGDGRKARVLDTCHLSGPRRPEMGLEAEWSCDWAELQDMSVEERNKIDVVVGHQYWEHGTEELMQGRDVRYFTVMRHPLHRKISFFYHFFVRNAGRRESDVGEREVIDFVLGREMPRSPLVRDAGPGYYASRLFSDGWSGFGGLHRFVRAEREGEELVGRAVERLRRHFVFIGLQTQEQASLCMLRRTVEGFARGLGIENLEGVEALEEGRERMNAGGYSLTGGRVWRRMTVTEREEFERVERVDLAIYRESRKIFEEMVRKFGCEHLVEVRDDDDMAL